MIIKSADDKQTQVDELEALLARRDVDARTSRQIEQELRFIRAGSKGERDAAYEIDFHYAKQRDRVVIHDLRLEVDGRVAQIDHLIIDRFLTIWVCESKHYGEGLAVDEHGEWVTFYSGRPRGIPSPIDQNRRHVAVLQDVFEQKLVEPKKRFGVTIKPQFKSVILVSNSDRISRPKGKAAAASVDGLGTVMKVEKLQSMITRDAEKRAISSLSRVMGTDTIERLGRSLVALHQPVAVDWAARFGLSPQVTAEGQVAPEAMTPTPSATTRCDSCSCLLSAAEGAYLSANLARFGGRMLCYQCQRTRKSS